MRLLFLGNNRLARDVIAWLHAEGEAIAGLVVHPPGKQRHGEEIIKASGLGPARILDGSMLRTPAGRAFVAECRAEIAVSVLFDYLLDKPLIDAFPRGVVNLHPSYLPFNRGQYPNVWSIVEGTPAGVTLHYIDQQVDTGDIISQRRVNLSAADTGKTLYEKLERASFELFRETWPSLRAGTAARRAQQGEGTYHRTRDVTSIDCIDLEKEYRAGDLIDILRARTFPPYRGAYFQQDGRRIYLRLELTEDNA